MQTTFSFPTSLSNNREVNTLSDNDVFFGFPVARGAFKSRRDGVWQDPSNWEVWGTPAQPYPTHDDDVYLNHYMTSSVVIQMRKLFWDVNARLTATDNSECQDKIIRAGAKYTTPYAFYTRRWMTSEDGEFGDNYLMQEVYDRQLYQILPGTYGWLHLRMINNYKFQEEYTFDQLRLMAPFGTPATYGYNLAYLAERRVDMIAATISCTNQFYLTSGNQAARCLVSLYYTLINTVNCIFGNTAYLDLDAQSLLNITGALSIGGYNINTTGDGTILLRDTAGLSFNTNNITWWHQTCKIKLWSDTTIRLDYPNKFVHHWYYSIGDFPPTGIDGHYYSVYNPDGVAYIWQDSTSSYAPLGSWWSRWYIEGDINGLTSTSKLQFAVEGNSFFLAIRTPEPIMSTGELEFVNVEQGEVWYDLDGAQNIRAGDYGNNIVCFMGGTKKLMGDIYCAGTFVHTSATLDTNGFTIHTI